MEAFSSLPKLTPSGDQHGAIAPSGYGGRVASFKSAPHSASTVRIPRHSAAVLDLHLRAVGSIKPFEDTMNNQSIFATLAFFCLAALSPAGAEDAKAPQPAAVGDTAQPAGPAEIKPSDNPPDAEMTAEEKAEREARKACKIDICKAFRTKMAEGPDISCPVVKSWRKDALTKLIAKLKVSWPYGPVHCVSTVSMKRADLVKAMTEDKAETKLDKHEVACTVDREKEAATQIKFDFAPTVTFEKGKATKAQINWGKIEAPALLKGAMWTATAADNAVNLLNGTLVEDINDFIAKKCDEVKSEWEGK